MNNPRESTNLLPEEMLHRVYDAITSAGLRIETLIGGLPPTLQASIRDAPSSADRTLVVLNDLNRAILQDGVCPLVPVLRTAHVLTRHRSEGGIFREALDSVGQHDSNSAESPPKVVNVLREIQQELREQRSDSESETRAWALRLLTNKIDRLREATSRARIPFGLFILFGFGILAVLAIDQIGWRRVMFQTVASESREAVTDCACKSKRVQRYLGISEQKANDCKLGDSLDALCREELGEQHRLLRQQYFTRDWMSIPLLNITVIGSDIHIIGVMACILLAFYLTASVRREHNALGELLNVKELEISKGTDEGPRTEVGPYLSLTERQFSPADLYLAQKAVAHTFVFQTSTPDPFLRNGTRVLMLVPFTASFLTVLRDSVDAVRYYMNITGAAHLTVSLFLVCGLGLITRRILRQQSDIYLTLRVLSALAIRIRAAASQRSVVAITWKDVLGARWSRAFASPGAVEGTCLPFSLRTGDLDVKDDEK